MVAAVFTTSRQRTYFIARGRCLLAAEPNEDSWKLQQS